MTRRMAGGLAILPLAALPAAVDSVERNAEGDRVATQFTSCGSHTGPCRGLEPTGREWVTEGIVSSRIEGGRIVEDWEITRSSGFGNEGRGSG